MDVADLVGRALASRRPPTAFVILRSSVAATVHGLLPFRFGRRVPADVSVASLEDAPFMRHLVPTVARYHVDSGAVVQLVYSALGRQLSSGIREGWDHRPIIPEFVPGETMGHVAAGQSRPLRERAT